jgi:3-hydroxybutyryl-CoA dehydratase
MALYLEDLEDGRTFESAGRTVTEADIAAFAGVSGDFNLLHTNELWVRENTPYRGRIAHGLLVLSISSGLATPGIDELVVLAYAEVSRRMVAPTYPGDTIAVTYTVESTRRSRSRPETGIANLAVEVRNQDGEVVQTGTDVLMVAAREAGG